MYNAEKVCDTTLDDEKYDVRCSEGVWDMTSILVTALSLKLLLGTSVKALLVTLLVILCPLLARIEYVG